MSFKRTILWITLLLIIFISGLFIWLVLPGPEVSLTQLIPGDAFAYASLKMSLTDSGISDLMNNLRLIANNPVVKIKERFLIKFVVPFFLPMEVATTAILNPDTKNTDYLILLKNNRLARLFRLSALLKLKPIKGKTYIVVNDIIIVSKQFSLAEKVLNSYKQRPTFLSSGVLDDLRSLRDSKDAALFVNNVGTYFSQFIKSLERKNAFVIFSTVDSIKWIEGYFDIIDADKIKGNLKFKHKEGTDVAEVRKDIDFFAKILQRFFKAEGLNFNREMISHGDSIDLNFEVSGLRVSMVGFLTKEKERY